MTDLIFIYKIYQGFLPNTCAIFKKSTKVFSLSLLLILISIGFSFAKDKIKNPELNFYYRKLNNNQASVTNVMLSEWLMLENPIFGYQVDGKNFFSLEDFVNTMEFAINPQDNGAIMSGWFTTEDQTFNLDLNRGECTFKDKKFRISRDNVIFFNNQIFVDLTILEAWFSMAMSYDVRNQMLKINSMGLSPVEKRYGRESQKQEVERKKENDDTELKTEKKIKLKKDDYKLASIPFGDLKYGYSNGQQTGVKTIQSKLDATLTADFLYLSNRLSFSTDNDKIKNLRLTSSRQDQDGNLLGILHARNVSFGDVYTPDVQMVSNTQSGEGLSISNYPEGYAGFNMTYIKGFSQPGWDVELYRNDFLLDFKTVSPNGTYDFGNVALLSGLNIIQLVFYGPYGKVKREVRKVYAGSDVFNKGEFYYHFDTNRHNKNLFQNDLSATDDARYGVGRHFAEFGYGITDGTTIVGDFIRIPALQNSNKTSDYNNISLRSSLYGMSGKFEVSRDVMRKANATQTSMQTTIFSNTNLVGKFTTFNKNYISEQHPESADPMLNELSFRLDGFFSAPHLINAPVRYTINDQIQSNYYRDKKNILEGDISLMINRKSQILQILEYDTIIPGESVASDTQPNRFLGSTFLSYKLSSKLTLRGSVAYDLKPNTNFTTTTLTSDYILNNQLSLNLSHNYTFPQDGTKGLQTYSMNLSRIFDKYAITFSGSHSNKGDYSVSANLSTSFGYDPKYHKSMLSSSSIANNGAVSAIVFLDENSNGIFDQGDKAIPDAEITIDHNKKFTTNENGTAFISPIRSNITVISLLTDSLPDPFWVVKDSQYRIVSHPGSIANIEFPVYQVGEITGFVHMTANNSPASDVILELIDDKQNVVSTTKSLYDGLYLFEKVPYGKYSIRVSLEQSKRLGFEANKVTDLVLNSKNQSITKINFIISNAPLAKKYILNSNKRNVKKDNSPTPKYILKNF